jgi:hypothetical protein
MSAVALEQELYAAVSCVRHWVLMQVNIRAKTAG